MKANKKINATMRLTTMSNKMIFILKHIVRTVGLMVCQIYLATNNVLPNKFGKPLKK